MFFEFDLKLNQTGAKNAQENILPVKSCNDNIKKTLKIVEQMIALSNTGDADREDVGCGILYGILRDSAYRIRKVAEAEMLSHQKKGTWE